MRHILLFSALLVILGGPALAAAGPQDEGRLSMAENTCAVLCQHWVHSHEEDTATERVFRPATYKFPPSRGRLSFELKADGGLIRYAIGPTDRSQTSQGMWRLEDHHLVLLSSPSAGPDQVLEIVSASPDRLVVYK